MFWKFTHNSGNFWVIENKMCLFSYFFGLYFLMFYNSRFFFFFKGIKCSNKTRIYLSKTFTKRYLKIQKEWVKYIPPRNLDGCFCPQRHSMGYARGRCSVDFGGGIWSIKHFKFYKGQQILVLGMGWSKGKTSEKVIYLMMLVCKVTVPWGLEGEKNSETER